jgi:MFS family permease
MQVLRMPQFWTMALSAALTFGALQAILVSLVPLAQETGLTIAQSASLLSAGATMSLLGKIVLAWLGDRVNRTVLLACLFSLVVPTSSALLFADSYPGYMACAAFLGLASGAITPAYLALVTDQFGPSSFGTANGSSLFITAIVCAISIRYGGEVYDWTGSYDVMFLTFIPTGVLSAVLMLSTRAFPHLAVEFRS